MKAVIYTKYGDPKVLQLKNVTKPVPKKNEILIKIYATSVNYGDLMVRNFKNVPLRNFNMPLPLFLPLRLFLGFNRPKITILGSQMSGEIEDLGSEVKGFKKGDQVFGYLGMKMGTYAEYLSMPADGCVTFKPINITFEEAAVVPYGALMAWGILKKVNIQPGQKVLINGASGGLGSAMVQLVKSHFKAEVTGVCSAPRLELVKFLGADNVIDYKKEDFTTNGNTYDFIIDILGRSTFAHCKKSLKPNGIYLLASFKIGKILQMFWTKIFGSKKVLCVFASDKQADLIEVKELIETGKIKSFIDRSFTLGQTADAHRYAEKGLKKGHIVITMNHDDKS